MFKRNLGASLRARRYHSQSREIRARILTHNLAILLRMCMFYTEHNRPDLSTMSPAFAPHL